MKKIFIPIMLLMLLIASPAKANPVSQNEAQSVAARFFDSHKRMAAKGQSTVKGNQMLLSLVINKLQEGKKDPAYYIFNATEDAGYSASVERGYVIISGDDQLPEVLGYSLEGSWPADEDLIPTPLKNALENYAIYVDAVREGKVEAPSVQNSEYTGTPVVGPLVTTKWNQSYPYNKYAPERNSSQFPEQYKEHYPIGCVAVALGQVLNYWGQKEGKPANPNDVNTFYTIVNSDGVLDTTYCSLSSSTKYDYTNIPDSIDYIPGNTENWETKAEAVGKFLGDVAYSMNMSWSSSGGSSITPGAADVTYRDFGFSLDSYVIYLEGYGRMANEENLALIKADLDKGYPVLAGGQSPNAGGHAFVFDGYDDNGLIHVNWGWGGSCNNWFDLAYLKTNMYDLNNRADYNFSNNQKVVLNLHPKQDGVDEKPHLDNRNIQFQSVGYAFGGLGIYAADSLMSMNVNGFTPVAYFDRDSVNLYGSYQATTYHKSFGYDYDFVLENKNLETGEVKKQEFRDTTTKNYGLNLVNTFISNDSLLNAREIPDGIYVNSGKMREVLNGETSDWISTDIVDTVQFTGNHIVMNPTAYKRYFHAENCVHKINSKSDYMLVHMEYDRDPSNLKVGDTLNIILEVQGTTDKRPGIRALFSKGATLKKSILGKWGEKTLVNHSQMTDIGAYIIRALLQKRAFIGKAYVATVVFDENDGGKTHNFIFSCPQFDITLINSVFVNNAENISNIALTTGICEVTSDMQNSSTGKSYSISGQAIDSNYHGIVIRGGRKYVK